MRTYVKYPVFVAPPPPASMISKIRLLNFFFDKIFAIFFRANTQKTQTQSSQKMQIIDAGGRGCDVTPVLCYVLTYAQLKFGRSVHGLWSLPSAAEFLSVHRIDHFAFFAKNVWIARICGVLCHPSRTLTPWLAENRGDAIFRHERNCALQNLYARVGSQMCACTWYFSNSDGFPQFLENVAFDFCEKERSGRVGTARLAFPLLKAPHVLRGDGRGVRSSFGKHERTSPKSVWGFVWGMGKVNAAPPVHNGKHGDSGHGRYLPDDDCSGLTHSQRESNRARTDFRCAPLPFPLENAGTSSGASATRTGGPPDAAPAFPNGREKGRRRNSVLAPFPFGKGAETDFLRFSLSFPLGSAGVRGCMQVESLGALSAFSNGKHT